MDGWMDEWMDGWEDGWVDEWMSLMDGWKIGSMGRHGDFRKF
jgi:hypothetical protein